MSNIQKTSTAFNDLIDRCQRNVQTFETLMNIVKAIPDESVFVAGGAVRDIFLKPSRPIKDLDIFLTFSAFKKIELHLRKNGVLQRNQFGTFRWFGHGDGTIYYDIIIIENSYNGLWPCRNIIDVLNQFDITANAIAYDLKNGFFYDPENGLRDIQQRTLRAVRFDYPELIVSPEIPLSRNTVLWFRYCHYAEVLELSIDDLTDEWIKKNAYRKDDFDLFKKHFFEPCLNDD